MGSGSGMPGKDKPHHRKTRPRNSAPCETSTQVLSCRSILLPYCNSSNVTFPVSKVDTNYEGCDIYIFCGGRGRPTKCEVSTQSATIDQMLHIANCPIPLMGSRGPVRVNRRKWDPFDFHYPLSVRRWYSLCLTRRSLKCHFSGSGNGKGQNVTP